MTDTSYAFKVVTMNAVGHSRNGIASLATPTVIARAGALVLHTRPLLDLAYSRCSWNSL